MKAIVQALPNEDICYIADSAHCPYGSKPPQEIRRLSHRITGFLVKKGCGVVVAACNTATAAAIEHLRAEYPHTAFVGMEPAVKPAAEQSHSGRIAVLATRGTLQGRLFQQTLHTHAKDADVQIIVGEGLEQGRENTPEAISALNALLKPALRKGVDTLVLGCTHYPFLSAAIETITKGSVRLVDAAMPVALQTKRLLEKQRLPAANNPAYFFYTSGNINVLQTMQERHLQLPNVQYAQLGV